VVVICQVVDRIITAERKCGKLFRREHCSGRLGPASSSQALNQSGKRFIQEEPFDADPNDLGLATE